MEHMYVTSDNWLELSLRLVLALVVGGVIGHNRQQGGRPAGMRTFMMVSMGAAFFVLIPLQAEGDSTFTATNALSRTIQGVGTGVGFLGAGLILQQSSRDMGVVKVRGLTTAASIWAVAGLGAAIGCGLWQMGLIGMGLMLLTLDGVKTFKKRVKRRVKLHRSPNLRAVVQAKTKSKSKAIAPLDSPLNSPSPTPPPE